MAWAVVELFEWREHVSFCSRFQPQQFSLRGWGGESSWTFSSSWIPSPRFFFQKSNLVVEGTLARLFATFKTQKYYQRKTGLKNTGKQTLSAFKTSQRVKLPQVFKKIKKTITSIEDRPNITSFWLLHKNKCFSLISIVLRDYSTFRYTKGENITPQALSKRPHVQLLKCQLMLC